MDDESRDMSLRLSNILERVGASERMRKLRMDTFISDEIQETVVGIITGEPLVAYRFGSCIEGTTTPCMNSDQDIVYCDVSRPVIYHIQHAPLEKTSLQLLVVTDNHTRPGYVKLQVVNNGTPCTIDNCIFDDPDAGPDNKGRICVKHRMNRSVVHTERGGPADTATLPGAIETDSVYALRSRSYPREGVEPLLECTRTGWLTMNDVEEMIQYGCLYVGVGHPSSDEKDYEWRVSFSLQERKLMFRLNPTQHRCYVLLKVIKDILTSKQDIGKSITSYHCKTCLFRVINRTHADQWTPDNLISCTFTCLSELLQCLRNGDLPNFFVKTNNMFERRVFGWVRERLIHHLSCMINEGYPSFYRIESDCIGEALRGHMILYRDMKRNLCRMTFDIYTSVCRNYGLSIVKIGKYLKHFAKEDTTRYLFQQLSYLSSLKTITEHTQDETKAAVQEIEQILRKFYAAHLASLAFSTGVIRVEHRLLQASARHLQHAMTYDLMTGRLLYATILYRQGNIDMCCDLLELLEQKIHKAVHTLCGCYHYTMHTTFYDILLLVFDDPDPRYLMKSAAAVCTVFLPSQTEIIPTALVYELYRSVATPHMSRREGWDDWFYLSVVDSKVYLYFLQYLVNFHLNRSMARRLATDNLLKQLLQEPNLGHRETGYNLLGWIYGQEGQIEAAAHCFLQSWKIRPHHNAAKWHMLNLIYRQHAARH